MRIVRAFGIAALLLFVVACTIAAEPEATSSHNATVHGSVVAGPTCPVERPGESACAPRPVADATIVVRLGTGSEVARVTTGADGSLSVALAPGTYTLVPQPVPGLMGTAEPMTISVSTTGSTVPSPLVLRYDTGIR